MHYFCLLDVKPRVSSLGNTTVDPPKSTIPLLADNTATSPTQRPSGSTLQALLQPQAGGYPQQTEGIPPYMTSSHGGSPMLTSDPRGIPSVTIPTEQHLGQMGLSTEQMAHMYGAPQSPRAVPVGIETYSNGTESDNSVPPRHENLTNLNTVSITSG